MTTREQIKIRMPEAKKNAAHAYLKFLERINSLQGTREPYINCILKFFEVAENKTGFDLATIFDEIKDKSTIDLMKECKNICKEAVNRDFVSYLSTGDRGNVGNIVYNSLK
ncbi:MAG TPA: hypothetical protein PKD85_00765 [Saprospiraceae bacterium]|nr:hypothetical protein [Saprospiraceae bacterium]